MKLSVSILLAICLGIFASCTGKVKNASLPDGRIKVIFDTDANNELDDQHALAYLVLNDKSFDVLGITVNTTENGGDIDGHYDEAYRVLSLCNLQEDIPIYKGANGSFEKIRDQVNAAEFDGMEAVNFIIETARSFEGDTLTLLPVGKLTNVALALMKAPYIADHLRIVWLGSNYPEPGEYNMVNDIPSMNYILEQNVPFEIVTVRYWADPGKPGGTDAVRVTLEEVKRRMPGLGPLAAEPVTGRHGSTFNTFGDYSVDLFSHIELVGDPPFRALFDLAAVAIVKNPAWAESYVTPSPLFIDGKWVENPDNNRHITIWENFNRDAIVEDMFETLESR